MLYVISRPLLALVRVDLASECGHPQEDLRCGRRLRGFSRSAAIGMLTVGAAGGPVHPVLR